METLTGDASVFREREVTGCSVVREFRIQILVLQSCSVAAGHLKDGQARDGATEVYEEVFLNTEGTEFFQGETQSVQQD